MVSGARWPGQSRSFRADLLRQGVVAASESDSEAGRPLVGCGRVLGQQRAVIVDPETSRLAGAGKVGEIWITGPSVALGYWGGPDHNHHNRENTFQATLAGSTEPRFLRTGDLGFEHDGQLFVAGRIKDLIIVRGRNYYPQDIELTAEMSHASALRGGAAAFSAETQDGEGIVVVQEMERGWDAARAGAVLDSIRAAIATEHEVLPHEVLLVRARSLPRTTNGKLRRRALRDAWLAGELDRLASSRHAGAEPQPDSIHREAILALPSAERTAAIVQALQFLAATLLRTAPENLAPDQSLISFGLDSLALVELNHRIQMQLGVTLSLATSLENSTLRALADLVAERVATESDIPAASPAAVPTNDGVRYYPLSHGQLALFYLHQLAPESAAYNIARAVRIEGPFDPAALRRAFAALVHRHAALRTTFAAETGEHLREPAQAVHPA